jgi:hypothetical protein
VLYGQQQQQQQRILLLHVISSARSEYALLGGMNNELELSETSLSIELKHCI